jgi:Flp pilus assembly protein TadG
MLMSLMRIGINATSDETGAVLVLFSVFMSVAILLCAFVIDVGNWFEHERHLQLQADAAAFAAAGKFDYPCTKTVERGIYQTAGQYGGANSVITPSGEAEPSATPLYNEQVGQVPPKSRQGQIHEEINHKSYYDQSTGDTTTVEKAPCEEGSDMIDVKMTETNLPFFFNVLGKAFDVVPYINAHARVSIVKEKYATAVEPIIESEPEEVRVFYVNDEPDGSDSTYTNDEMLATGLLKDIGSNEEKGTIKWTDASSPVALKVNKPHIGVRIALAGKAGALTGAGNETPEVCLHVYVECFDEDSGVVPPLLNISGYSMEKEGKATKPFEAVAHKVALSTPSPDTCVDAYFNNWPLSEKAATCTITVSAELTYGKESTNATGVTVTPELKYTEGFGGHAETKTQTPLKLEGGVWTGTLNLPSYFYGNFGSTEVNLKVKCEPKVTKSVCSTLSATEEKTLSDVQRAFSAGPDGSDRIVAAKVFEPGVAPEKDADAFEICEKADKEECTHKLAATVELSGSLEDAKKYFTKESAASCATEKVSFTSTCQPIPPFHVFYGDNDQESDDQFVVSCPPTTNKVGVVTLYQESLFHGCAGKYSVNTHGGSCATEKSAQEKIEAEEKVEKEAREKEEAAKTKREKEEKEAKEKWEKEEKETKITKTQRETKEKEQKTNREKFEKEEKTGVEKRAAEEAEAKKAKEKRETEEANVTAARKVRETAEAEERKKWETEEKETKITKAEREAKEKTAETKALWERQEGKGEITKAQREAKEKTKAQLEKEEKEFRITKKQREEREKEKETKAFWERQEGKGEITKAQRETKEKTKAQLEKEEKETKITKAEREAKEKEQKTNREKFEKEEKTGVEKRAAEEAEAKKAKEKRETEEANVTAARKVRETAEAEERKKWETEEKETKITKAQREAKEKEQTTTREAAERTEKTAREKRELEERVTKEAKEKLGAAAHECVGLVEANGKENFKGSTEGELAKELTTTFQSYLAKRVEGELNGTHFYCPNRWVNNNEGGIPIIPPNDSRLVQFFVVPFTVTDFERKSEVSPLVPIVNFATFYITGWDSGNSEAGQGTGKAWSPKERRDECSEKLFNSTKPWQFNGHSVGPLTTAERAGLENEAIPLKQREREEKEKGFDDDTEQPREVVGHLIKYVNVLGEVSGTEGCKLEGVETCEAVLTE